MKYSIFITILLTILSVFFIATPIEAVNVTLEAGFPVTIPKEAKQEFSNVVKAQIFKKVDFKNLTAIKVKGLKKKVANSIDLENFIKTNPTNASSVVELQNILLNATQIVLDSTSKAIIDFGIIKTSVQFTFIIDGVGKNVAAAKKKISWPNKITIM
jgi:hypothetical protein